MIKKILTLNMLFSIYKNNKIIRENKGKIMKESEFQQFLIEQFEKQNNFNEQQLKFNELFWNRLDSIENRLTRLESFHEK